MLRRHLHLLEAKYGDRPYNPLYWFQWLTTFWPFALGALAAVPLARPLARRLARGRVVVSEAAISAGNRRIALPDVARIETGEGPSVTIALKNGRSVRGAFAADRPVVERDLFVARVRELLVEAPAPSYPSAETSGVRVALPPSAEPDVVEASDETEETDEPAPRAARS